LRQEVMMEVLICASSSAEAGWPLAVALVTVQ
jgi:hypothetical protein